MIAVIFLNDAFYEAERRGTPDFPIGFYHVEQSHLRYRMRAQWHNDIEIDRVLSGELTIWLNNEKFVMHSGDSVIIPGGVVHSAVGKDCVYECTVFSPTVLYATQKTKNDIKTKLRKPIFLNNDENIKALFETLAQDGGGEELLVLSKLYAIVQKAVSRQEEAVTSRTEYAVERIKPAISYIEENYMKNITLSSLAAVCSMSPNYFCSFFRDVTGQTPGKYITASRIDAACRKLLEGMSVTECALACGFNDVSYFIRVFRSETSLSPKKYAGKYIKNKKRQG